MSMNWTTIKVNLEVSSRVRELLEMREVKDLLRSDIGDVSLTRLVEFLLKEWIDKMSKK